MNMRLFIVLSILTTLFFPPIMGTSNAAPACVDLFRLSNSPELSSLISEVERGIIDHFSTNDALVTVDIEFIRSVEINLTYNRNWWNDRAGDFRTTEDIFRANLKVQKEIKEQSKSGGLLGSLFGSSKKKSTKLETIDEQTLTVIRTEAGQYLVFKPENRLYTSQDGPGRGRQIFITLEQILSGDFNTNGAPFITDKDREGSSFVWFSF